MNSTCTEMSQTGTFYSKCFTPPPVTKAEGSGYPDPRKKKKKKWLKQLADQ